jgi:hypothetical protein
MAGLESMDDFYFDRDLCIGAICAPLTAPLGCPLNWEDYPIVTTLPELAIASAKQQI